jgi:hypothetical protein
MNFIKYAFACWQLWRDLKRQDVACVALRRRGVPQLVLLGAIGPEVERAIDLATEVGGLKEQP